jgi:hypothetical protein
MPCRREGGTAPQEDEEHMNKAVKFAVVVGIGLALLPLTAIAQEPAGQAATAPAAAPVTPPEEQPTKTQLANLFEVMHVREQMQSMMKMLPAMIQKQMQEQAKEMASKQSGGALTPTQQEAFAKMMGKYMEKALNIYTTDELIDDMGAIYQRHLTSSDVDALIGFYSSPAGQHLLAAQPAIMAEYMPLVMKRAGERAKELSEELTRDLKNLPEFGAQSGSKPPDQ